MYWGKYSAVIGRELAFVYVPSVNMQAMGLFKSITVPYRVRRDAAARASA